MRITHIKKILNDTIEYYKDSANLPGISDIESDECINLLNILISELYDAEEALHNSDFRKTIDILIEIYNFAEEHELINNLQYPGPEQFAVLV